MMGNKDYSQSVKIDGFPYENIDAALQDVKLMKKFYFNSYIQFDKVFELENATKEEV